MGPKRSPVPWAAFVAVVVRPMLWRSGLRALRSLAPRGWWRRAPFLPLPDPGYMAFRMQTQYGGEGTTPPRPGDVVEYLRWLRRRT
ncbi:MAG: hypothetical protein ACKOBT_11475 [Actinomycetota bacterium]